MVPPLRRLKSATKKAKSTHSKKSLSIYQLYIALSQARSFDGVCIFIEKNHLQTVNQIMHCLLRFEIKTILMHINYIHSSPDKHLLTLVGIL